MRNDTGYRDRRHDAKYSTSYKRHHRIGMIQKTEPFFPQLTTKHSDTLNFSNRNVCDRTQRKSVLN